MNKIAINNLSEKELDSLFNISLNELRNEKVEAFANLGNFAIRVTSLAKKQMKLMFPQTYMHLFASIISISNFDAFCRMPLVLKEPWQSYGIRTIKINSYRIFIVVNRYRKNVDILAFLDTQKR